MDYRHALTDEQWEKLKDHLPGKKSDPGQTAKDNRLFINAVMWISRTGAPWRDLPEDLGKWSNVHKRFTRWSKKGVWQMIFNTLAVNGDTQWLMIDSTIIRVHQHAAGGAKPKDAQETAIQETSKATGGKQGGNGKGEKKSKHWTIQRRPEL